jgi:hypothetical protein
MMLSFFNVAVSALAAMSQWLANDSAQNAEEDERGIPLRGLFDYC